MDQNLVLIGDKMNTALVLLVLSSVFENSFEIAIRSGEF